MFTDEQAENIQKSFLAICVPCYGGQVTEKHYVSMVSYTIACMRNDMTFSLETMANESIKIWNKSINTRIKKFFLFLRINSLKIAKDFGDILLINLFIIFNTYLHLVSHLLLTRIFLNLFLFTILRIIIFKVNTYKKIKNF